MRKPPEDNAMMPAVFFGHGNPMNAIERNVWTQAWSHWGASLPKPEAILCISAHWYLPRVAVTVQSIPKTIHDFGGFPKELYEVEYPAPGSPELAKRVRDILSPVPVTLDDTWGLDHGTWAVLTHVFPDADVPIVQLSIDERQPAAFHYEIGKKLASLREEGVLVIGSGNLVHNLHAYAWGQRKVGPYEWGARFEKKVREKLLAREDSPLVEYEKLGQDALLSAPTPDHYLPFLYIIGMRKEGEPVSFPVEGFDGGSISMLAVQIG
jgi:4,5-DOPA dioxygenase extradiol